MGVPLRPVPSTAAFSRSGPDWPAPYPSVVISVDDIDAAMKKVQGAGGDVLGEPMPIPGVGRYVSIMDSEGNRISMLQPEPRPN